MTKKSQKLADIKQYAQIELIKFGILPSDISMTKSEVNAIIYSRAYALKAQEMDKSPNKFERREYNELCN